MSKQCIYCWYVYFFSFSLFHSSSLQKHFYLWQKVWLINSIISPLGMLKHINHCCFPSFFNPFRAVGWYIYHYFFVKFFRQEKKINPKNFKTFGWMIYPVSVFLWVLRLKDFDILNKYYEEFKIEKMAKFDTLIVPIGLRSPV